jgi:hypothetical protein
MMVEMDNNGGMPIGRGGGGMLTGIGGIVQGGQIITMKRKRGNVLVVLVRGHSRRNGGKKCRRRRSDFGTQFG